LPPRGGIDIGEPGLENPFSMCACNAESGFDSTPPFFVRSGAPGMRPRPSAPWQAMQVCA
jgi:hypothetical protein